MKANDRIRIAVGAVSAIAIIAIVIFVISAFLAGDTRETLARGSSSERTISEPEVHKPHIAADYRPQEPAATIVCVDDASQAMILVDVPVGCDAKTARAWSVPPRERIVVATVDMCSLAGDDGSIPVPNEWIDTGNVVVVTADGCRRAALPMPCRGQVVRVLLQACQDIEIVLRDASGSPVPGQKIVVSRFPALEATFPPGVEILPGPDSVTSIIGATSDSDALAAIKGCEPGRYFPKLVSNDYVIIENTCPDFLDVPGPSMEITVAPILAAAVDVSEFPPNSMSYSVADMPDLERGMSTADFWLVRRGLQKKYPSARILVGTPSVHWLKSASPLRTMDVKVRVTNWTGARQECIVKMRPIADVRSQEKPTQPQDIPGPRRSSVRLVLLDSRGTELKNITMRLFRKGSRPIHVDSGEVCTVEPGSYSVGFQESLISEHLETDQVVVQEQDDLHKTQEIGIRLKTCLTQLNLRGIADWGPMAFTGWARIECGNSVSSVAWVNPIENQLLIPRGPCRITVQAVGFERSVIDYLAEDDRGSVDVALKIPQ